MPDAQRRARLILPASVAPDGTRKALMRTYPTGGTSGGTTEPRSKSCSLRQLPPDLERKLRSSTIVTSVGQLVEELVCNSIDAGAHDVSVVIDTGSTLSVTVSDDGCGMSVKDVKLVATNRHHTSKIHSISDLGGSLRTLGFRGEALASIAEFCVLQVTTRAAGSFETFSKICSKVGGLTLFVRTSHHVQNLTSRSPQGQTLSCGPARNQLTKAGTIVACKDLFYTHPVRRGVIRRNIAKQLEDTRVRLYRLALIHPEVGFLLKDVGARHDVLRALPGRSLLSILSDAFGKFIASKLIPLSNIIGEFRLTGYVTAATSETSLPSSELQFFYVNRRFVRRTLLHNAVSKAFALACASLDITTHGCPGYVLCLECPPDAYDITFDPEKTLIEFTDWKTPLDLLKSALKQVWPHDDGSNITTPLLRTLPTTPPPNIPTYRTAHELTPDALGMHPQSPPSPPHDFGLGECVCCPPSRRRRQTFALQSSAYEDASPPICQMVEPFEDAPALSAPVVEEGGGSITDLLADWKRRRADRDLNVMETVPVAEISRNLLDDAKVLTQWGKKFILAMSASGDLLAIDQHAADERILLEQLRASLIRSVDHRGKLHTYSPASPMPTTVLGRSQPCLLTASELAILRANSSLVWSWGWRWEDVANCDGDTDEGVKLTGLPTVEGTMLGADALAEYLRQVSVTGPTSAPPPALHRLLASKACRSAIMFGDNLGQDECVALLGSLTRTELPLHCAHGRPTSVMLAPNLTSGSSGPRKVATTRKQRLVQRAWDTLSS